MPLKLPHSDPFMDITDALRDDKTAATMTASTSSEILSISHEEDLGTLRLRAPSRLGFRFAQSDGGCEGDLADAETRHKLRWTFNPFDTTEAGALDFEEDERDSEKDYLPATLADISFSSSSSSELDGASSEDSGSDEEDESALFTMFPNIPVTPPTPPTKLAPPRPSKPARPPPAPPLGLPELRHGISTRVSALSPLSPHYHHVPNSPFDPPDPRKLQHHGLSQSSLMHQKWLWAQRYEEWIAWEAEVAEREELAAEAEREAYGGIALLSGTCDGKSGLKALSSFPSQSFTSSLFTPTPPTSKSTPTPTSPTTPIASTPPPNPNPNPNPNSKIYPRIGDLSALRDPYSAAIDRCFCRFPLWTMQKALFMFDLHHRADAFSEHERDQCIVTARSDPTLETATESVVDVTEPILNCRPVTDINITVTEVTSDSEETAGEGEGDMTLLSIDDCDSNSDITVFSPSNSCVSSAKTMCASLPGDGDEHDEEEEESEDFHTSEGARAWEVSWYARWTLLTELVKRDAKERHNPASARREPKAPAEPSPMFFLAEEEELESEDEDVWDDEDEDYGRIVANPIYGQGRSSIQIGFERAQEFFAVGNVNRGIDVRSGAKMLVA